MPKRGRKKTTNMRVAGGAGFFKKALKAIGKTAGKLAGNIKNSGVIGKTLPGVAGSVARAVGLGRRRKMR
jgi:hypothetical protein